VFLSKAVNVVSHGSKVLFDKIVRAIQIVIAVRHGLRNGLILGHEISFRQVNQDSGKKLMEPVLFTEKKTTFDRVAQPRSIVLRPVKEAWAICPNQF
jgi:hypothetical protein